MTDRQRQRPAAFIRERPFRSALQMYALGFLGCRVTYDVMNLLGASSEDELAPYLLPLILVFVLWPWRRGKEDRAEAQEKREIQV
ncbi:hypothetical protein DRQ50_06810 [bacterium]|nr:MAG: hypothetical protein DRQ50_06810 [bacterium]